MPPDERGYLIVPHELATGADCDGCLMVVEHGDMVEIKCNSCGGVVDTVPIRHTGTRLMELASVEISSALCPRCGATNMFRGFTVIEMFICRECGEGVSVERPADRFARNKKGRRTRRTVALQGVQISCRKASPAPAQRSPGRGGPAT